MHEIQYNILQNVNVMVSRIIYRGFQGKIYKIRVTVDLLTGFAVNYYQLECI